MMQCPNCGARSFEVGMTISTIVTIECEAFGDYTEVHDNRQNCDWHWMKCLDCGAETDQEDAEDAIEKSIAEDENSP